MGKRSFFCHSFGACSIPYRTALHIDDGMLPVLPSGRRGETVHMLRVDLFQNAFKADGRDMMTFIHDNHAVLAHKVLDGISVETGLQNRYIDRAVQVVSIGAKRPYRRPGPLAPMSLLRLRRLRFQQKKLFQRFLPLRQQSLRVDEDQRVDLSLGDQIRGDHGFPEGRRNSQYANIVQ